jgi:small subunit ribosomal protein S6
MTNSKRLYETTFIINASIEDSQIEALNAHVQEIITGNGGEIRAVNRWGRKRLAYPIQKKNNGYYVNVEFSDIGTVIPRLEHMFLLDENILRFLTIQLDKKAIKARQQAPIVKPIQEAPPLPPEPAEREPLFTDEPEVPGEPKSV